MLAHPAPYYAPTADAVAADASLLSVLRRVARNPLEAIPAPAYHARMTRQRLFGKDVWFVTDPDLVAQILVADWLDYPKSPLMKRSLGPAVGTRSMLTADPADWRWQRRAAAPGFRHDKLLGFVPSMAICAEDAALSLLQARGPVDLGKLMMNTTLDIIVETMLSGKANLDAAAIDRDLSATLAMSPKIAVLTILGLPRWFPYPGKFRGEAAIRRMRADMQRIISARRADRSEKVDLLDLLLKAQDSETGRAMSDGELIDNLLTFILAGHETTANALTWAFWLIANDPQVEARLVEEVTRVCGDGPLEAAHVESLTYVKQVFHEAMRLYPPAPMLTRLSITEGRLGDVVLPPFTGVLVPIYAVHRHHSLWDDPERFDPDRFAPDRPKPPRGTYLPFGDGPRICIGAAFATIEAVLIMAAIIRKVRITRRPDMAAPRPVTAVTLRPQEPMIMDVVPR